MNYRLSLFLGLLGLMIMFTSCTKDEETTPAPTTNNNNNNNNTANTTPNFPGSDGTLWAINSISLQTLPIVGTFEVELGTGVAVFTDDNYSSFLAAGSVNLNGSDLTKNANNSYTFTPSMANPNGLDFSGGAVDWTIGGSGSVPAFTESVNSIPFPEVDTITSAITIDRSMDYTLTTSTVTGADSVIFMIGGVMKTLVGSSTSYTFTSSDLSALSAGPSVAQIAAYRFTNSSISGKSYYFGKQEVQTRSVTIQ